ncbi:TlpA family protein disulfide reductase [Sphingomonas sp. HDW15A]|nr:TlpA family protein disulfide reductase [Sphingomonas sp. HDW15A]
MALAGCDREEAAPPQEANADASAASPGASSGASAVPVKGVDRSKAGTPAPDVTFQNPDGGEFTLSRSKGSPVLVNLWATWCAPCVKELPTLQKLDERHAVNGDLGIMIVSQDMAGKATVDSFLTEKGIKLRSFLDPEMKLSGALGVEVMPTTILYDSNGREVWRYIGDLDWTGEEARKLLAEAAAPKG